MSVQVQQVSSAGSHQTAVRVLAVLTAIAGLLGAGLPFVSGGGDGGTLFGSGTSIAVLVAITAGLLLLGALTAGPGRAGGGLAGGAGLFLFGLYLLLVLIIWPLISAFRGFGGIGVGAGFVLSSIAAGLGLITWLASLGSRPRSDIVPVAHTAVRVFGPLVAVGLLVGLTLPPPDRHIGWSDWAFPYDSHLPYAAQINIGLAAFYLGGTLAIFVGFAVGTRWGMAMAAGGFAPLAWFAFAWLADVDDDIGGNRWSQAFKSEFHPLFGIACGAVALVLAIGWASLAGSTNRSMEAAPASPPQWAPDPYGQHRLRYWDGLRWTEHVSDPAASSPNTVQIPAMPAWRSPAPGPEPPAADAPVAADAVPPAAVDPLWSAASPVPPLLHLGRPLGTSPTLHDGLTQPRTPVPVAAAWRLRFDDGVLVEVTGLTLIGREPGAGPNEDATLVPVADPDRSLSKTHLAVGVDDHGVWVSDRHSTNGTTSVTASGEVALAPDVRTYVPVGTVIRAGDRSFTVESAT